MIVDHINIYIYIIIVLVKVIAVDAKSMTTYLSPPFIDVMWYDTVVKSVVIRPKTALSAFLPGYGQFERREIAE